MRWFLFVDPPQEFQEFLGTMARQSFTVRRELRERPFAIRQGDHDDDGAPAGVYRIFISPGVAKINATVIVW
jgi:hypothetical protein